MLSEKQKLEEHNRWQRALYESLSPMVSEGETGIVAARIFYAVRHRDGTMSYAQAGITPEKEQQAARDLVRHLLLILMDMDNNHKIQKLEGKPKS